MFLSGDPGAPEAVAVNWFASWVALVASRPVKDATAAAPCSLSEAGAGPRGRQFRKVGGGPTPRFEDIRILWDVMAHEPVETACWYTNRNYIRSPTISSRAVTETEPSAGRLQAGSCRVRLQSPRSMEWLATRRSRQNPSLHRSIHPLNTNRRQRLIRSVGYPRHRWNERSLALDAAALLAEWLVLVVTLAFWW